MESRLEKSAMHYCTLTARPGLRRQAWKGFDRAATRCLAQPQWENFTKVYELYKKQEKQTSGRVLFLKSVNCVVGVRVCLNGCKVEKN